VSAADLIGGWRLNAALLVIAALGLFYASGARRVPRWPRRRTAAFGAGLAALAVALCSGFERHADQLLSVHMAQHLLLSLAAAPLLVLGAPLRLALGALPRGAARALADVAAGRLGTLARPVVAGTLFALAGLALHVPAVYDASIRDPWLHAGAHAAFLTAALLFWTPLLAPEPLAHRLSAAGRLAYVLLAMPAMAVVGVGLSTAGSVVYAPYERTTQALGLSPLADQHLAGGLMWIAGALVLGVAFVASGWQALLAEERRAIAREARGA
jgi:putative copper resistance protein D